MKVETRTRLFAVDNLRVVLTALVVLHHVAVTYGHIPAWYHFEEAKDASGVLLDILVMFNQAFFMGFFFLISGFFTPASHDRKGGRAFMRDRLKRLGIPLLVFILLLRPVVTFGFYQGDMPYWMFYLGSWDAGPMWFVEVLLVFSAVYTLWPKRAEEPRRTELTARAVALFALGLSLATFLWRFLVPVGVYWNVVGLPTPAYLPQYASMFVVGVLAHRRGWFETLPDKAGRIGLLAATGLSLVLVPMSWMFEGVAKQALDALWESTFAVSVIVGLSVLFRNRHDRQGQRGGFLSEHAYAVYFVHPVVLVAVSYALVWLHTLAIVKFAVVAAVALPLCWGVAWLVRALPGAKRVL
ncbi:acyltransferase family protein [Streptosporangium saharense]|uniref:acyltransferase family protein n=1 Tax=Streptosporangium saharense TaxID=1706840 RepID=UPI0033190CB6